MNPNNAVHKLAQASLVHAEFRSRLMREYELEADDQALADTLEGISDFNEMCFAAIREANESEAMAEALSGMIAEMQVRKKRLTDKAKRIRAIVGEEMLRAGETKLTAPDMTLSAREGKPTLFVPDPEAMPTEYCQQVIKYVPDKDKIREAMEAGKTFNFATTEPPKPVLTVRTK